MDPSIASEFIAHLTTAIEFASDGLQDWSWVIFTALTIITVLVSLTKRAVSGGSFDSGFWGGLVWSAALVAIVVGGYFFLSMPWMELIREAGMRLSGSSAETVDIGEMARQADDISKVIDDTIRALKSGGFLSTISYLPEITALMILKAVVHILFAIIALIAIWIFSKFCLGFLVGGVFIAGLANDHTYEYGKKSFSYVFVSAMPLFLLAFLQGFSASLLEGVTLTPGAPATIPGIGRIIMMQGFTVVLSMAAAVVPKEWLMSGVGTSGAPSGTGVAQAAGGAGAAATNTISSVMNMIGGSGGNGGGGGSIGTGGGGPQSVGSAPQLTSRS